MLFVVAAAVLFGLQLLVGRELRALGGLVWFGATLLMIALLAGAALFVYGLGRRLLQRRYPAGARHPYWGGLGVTTSNRLVRRPAEGEQPLIALTFTFSNDEFAAMTAALHATQARPVTNTPAQA